MSDGLWSQVINQAWALRLRGDTSGASAGARVLGGGAWDRGGVTGSLGIKSKCRGWAWGLTLLPWDAEPHLGNGLIFQRTNGTQKTDSQ